MIISGMHFMGLTLHSFREDLKYILPDIKSYYIRDKLFLLIGGLRIPFILFLYICQSP